LLTAKHCTLGLGPADLVATPAWKRLGEQQACASVEHAVLRIFEHPSLDLALVLVPDDGGSEAILPLADAAPDTGGEVLLAGFGLTEANKLGEFRALSAQVVGVDSAFVVVQGRGGGACLGDSGGPLISKSEPRVSFGVLSQGSASCLGKDYYVNLWHAAGWVGQVIGGGDSN
jgi:hypothetical protein